MIDESKKKMLLYISVLFIVIVIIFSILYYVFQGNKSDLPPIDTETTSANTSDDTSTSFKNGVTFIRFNTLIKDHAITNTRVDVIQYYLAAYASSQSASKIQFFTLDQSSIKDIMDGERHIITFNTTDNNKLVYKVELSYTYSADAYVRIFDKDNKVIQSSPFDAY